MEIGTYIHENLSLSITMNCRAPTAIELKTKLGFNQHNVIMTKKKSVLTKIMKVFRSEKILPQHSVLGYRIDLYLPRHKLAIEIDEKGLKDKDEHEEIERQKATEKELGCEFIRIILDEKDFDGYVEIGKIYNHINKSSKKSLIDTISRRLSELEFNSNHLIKSEFLNNVVKKMLSSL